MFWLSIPGIILGGAGLTICLIARQVVRNEEVARKQHDYENEKINCQKVCVQLEQWLKDLKQTCEDLKATLPVVDLKNQTATLTKASHQKLIKILNEMPKNDLKKWAEELQSCHLKMFGEKRQIGKGSWSDYWIRSQFKQEFGGKLDFFYTHAITLERRLHMIQNRQEDMKI